jgi:branched-chain amino acid transport system ATP-binding protein
MLSLNDIHVDRAGRRVLSGVSLEVATGEIVALIGTNGAGKSTTLRTISGLHHPSSGTIRFEGRDIAGVLPEVLIRSGVTHCPEGRQLFAELSVAENIALGAYVRRDHKRIADDRDFVLTCFPRLAERLGQRAGTLSGGEQQMLALARALMSGPRLLLLDEPSMGIAPKIVLEILEIVGSLNRERRLAVLLVEQNVHLAFGLATRAYLLEAGRVALSGAVADLKSSELVRTHYLGGGSAPSGNEHLKLVNSSR